jgi:nucleoside-diphosphate-sugar epimerase
VSDAYHGRHVLVLGGSGFLGTNLTRRLAAAGAQVTMTSAHALGIGMPARNVRHVMWQAGDMDGLRALVQGTEVVFSLFGRSGAVRSLREPDADLSVNCGGQLAVLEAVRTERPDAKVIFPGSRLQFGRVNALPVDESHAMEPLDLYGVHKLASEQYHRIYHRVHRLRTTTLRITNPYGPGQPADRRAYGFVNGLVHRALVGEALTIFGDGRQLRDVVYIDDVTAALMAVAATTGTDGEVYNLGSGAGVPLVAIAEMIVRLAGRGRIEYTPWPAMAEIIETGDFVADVSKLTKTVDWRPQVSLEEGLARTIAASREGAA